jgi:hypothetical protein
MKRIISPLIVVAAVVLSFVFDAHAGEQEPAKSGTVILDTHSYWRVFVTLRPVVFGNSEKAEPHKKGCVAVNSYSRGATVPLDGPKTALPPKDWMQPDFDDARWWRDPGPYWGGKGRGVYGRSRPHNNRWGVWMSSNIALMCVRGKFGVTDPVQVKSLKLTMDFRGGMVIYLNGKEVKRLHMRDGQIDMLTLAEDYPVEASVRNGKLHDAWHVSPRELIDLRVRSARDVEIPVKYLRKGVNVLALEVHRCAMPSEMLKLGRRAGGSRTGLYWTTVGLMDAKLAAEGEGITPNTARPKGIQVWNANPLESIYVSDYGDPNEKLGPVRIVGTRNGSFAGQVIVGSNTSLKGLAAEVSDLHNRKGKGTISASGIDVRWPRPTILTELTPKAPHPWPSKRNRIGRFEALAKKPPKEVGVWKTHPRGGAVQPVWLTVPVPDDAEPGDYEGTLTIRVAGSEPIVIPVALQVRAFRLPEPKDFHTWVDFIHMAESVAFHYNLPHWSEEHWRMVEESLRIAEGVGNKTLYIPLINRTNLGNTQTMVRWIKRGDGYIHDFSIAERFIDTALKVNLRPEALCFQVWDYHIGMNTERLGPRGSYKIGTGMYGQLTVKTPQPVPVSLLDPTTGEVKEMLGPKYTDPGVEAFWGPVAAGMMDIVKKRGLEKSLMLGLAGDYVPPRVTVELWHKLIPDAEWITMAHGRASKLFGVPVGYSTTVFGARYAVDPEIKRFLGWSRPEIVAYFPRFGVGGYYPAAFERLAFEKGISGNMRGMGRQSLDDFPLRGARYGSSGCCWGSLTLAPPWLAAGKEGPVSSVRFQMGREGIQECEARIHIEKALVDEALKAKLGDELAKKCREIVDERTRCVLLADEKGENGRVHSSSPGGPLGFDWFAGSDWQSRSAKLYAAAAEVTDALKP